MPTCLAASLHSTTCTWNCSFFSHGKGWDFSLSSCFMLLVHHAWFSIVSVRWLREVHGQEATAKSFYASRETDSSRYLQSKHTKEGCLIFNLPKVSTSANYWRIIAAGQLETPWCLRKVSSVKEKYYQAGQVVSGGQEKYWPSLQIPETWGIWEEMQVFSSNKSYTKAPFLQWPAPEIPQSNFTLGCGSVENYQGKGGLH